jgi:hypothetical protein
MNYDFCNTGNSVYGHEGNLYNDGMIQLQQGTEFGVEKMDDGSMKLTAFDEFNNYCSDDQVYIIPKTDSSASLATSTDSPVVNDDELVWWNRPSAIIEVDPEEPTEDCNTVITATPSDQ